MRKYFMVLSALALAIIGLQNCRHDFNNTTNISSYGSDESHHAGRNCMDCHRLGSDGDGWFTAAGTAYDAGLQNTYAGATVRLYTQPNGGGTVAATIQVDKKGNFYTTEKIDFSKGLFPSVTGTDGSTQYMGTAISTYTAPCNSCHGVSTDRIFVK